MPWRQKAHLLYSWVLTDRYDDAELFFRNIPDWMQHCYTSEVNTVRDITLRKMYTACTETLRGLRLSKGIHEWQAEWERSALYASIVTHQNKVLGKSIPRRRAVPSFDMLHLRCCLYPLPFFRSHCGLCRLSKALLWACVFFRVKYAIMMSGTHMWAQDVGMGKCFPIF